MLLAPKSTIATACLRPFVRHLVRQQAAGVLEREGLDVHDLRGEAGRVHGGLALLDVLAAGRDEQDVEHVGIALGAALHLEVVAHLFHGEGDVLVGLQLDLALELAVVRASRASG